MLENTLFFAPLLVTLVVLSVTRRYAFRLFATTLSLGIGGYFAMSVMFGKPILIPVVQMITAVVILVLVLGLLGRKAVGEAFTVMGTSLLLFPLAVPRVALGVAVYLSVGFIGTLVVGFRRWNAHLRSTQQGNATTVKDALWQAGVDSGIASRQLPSGDNLPNRDLVPASARVSSAPFFLLGAVLSALLTVIA